jgi:hypothetical protein
MWWSSLFLLVIANDSDLQQIETRTPIRNRFCKTTTDDWSFDENSLPPLEQEAETELSPVLTLEKTATSSDREVELTDEQIELNNNTVEAELGRVKARKSEENDLQSRLAPEFWYSLIVFGLLFTVVLWGAGRTLEKDEELRNRKLN